MGRRKKTADYKEVIAFFSEMMRNQDASDTARMRAAEMLCKLLNDGKKENEKDVCVQIEYEGVERN